MKKTCKRCEGMFECNHTNITNCGCVTVPLDKNMRKYIEENYDDCLCPQCLEIIKENFYAASVNPKFK